MRQLIGIWIGLVLTVLHPQFAMGAPQSTYSFESGEVGLVTRPSEESGSLEAVVHFKLQDGWHIYGPTLSGEIGLPTTIEWTLPPKVSVVETKWPEQVEFEFGGFKSSGYEHELTVSATLSSKPDDQNLPAGDTGETLAGLAGSEIQARVSWLLCSDTCVPGSAVLTRQISAADLASGNLPAATPAGATLALALVMGLLGGILLNFMPCVFPILSMKILSLVDHADSGAARSQSLVFALGVVSSFLLLAGLLMGLRAAGAELGWGFQFQSPVFVFLMILVFFLVAMNLFGVFEVGASVQNAASRADNRSGMMGSFLSGVLATAVATPCTAPLMGTALAVALARPAAEGLLIFLALGTGMALPVVLLSFYPRFLRMLPRPGAWMAVLKKVLAFPIMATVAWLLWVLQAQVSADGVLRVQIGLVMLGFGAWIFGLLSGPAASLRVRRIGQASLCAALLATALLAWPTSAASNESLPVSPSHDELVWESFSRDRLESLRRSHQPVLVDITAQWCLTCQVNHRVALSGAVFSKKIREHGITLMRGDWTRRNADISAFIRSFGRDGVPLNVFFSASDRAPQVMPALLTQSALLEVLDNAH